MPQTRRESELNSPHVSLHIGASSEAAWQNVIQPWFEKVADCSLQSQLAPAIVTASRSQAYFFRNRLLSAGKSLIGVKFLSPPQLRETLLREVRLKLPLREHLRLLLAVTAEEFGQAVIAAAGLDPKKPKAPRKA